MHRGLREVIGDILTHSGAVVETRPEGDLEAVVPPKVSTALRIPEYATLTFTYDEGHSDTVYASYDSDLFRALSGLIGDKGRLSFASVEPFIPRTEKAAAQIAEKTIFANATFRPDITEVIDITYLLALFKYTAISDEKQEGIVPVLMNCMNRSVTLVQEDISGVMEMLKDNIEPKNSRTTLMEMVRPIYRAASGLVMERMGDFVRGSERRLNRDVKRVYEYYETLKGEAKRTFEKKAASEGVSLDNGDGRLSGKLEALEMERKWKIQDLTSKYALNIHIEPVSLIGIETRGVVFWLNIKRRLASRRFPVTYNPITRHFDPLPCESCFHPKNGYYACEDRLHIVCSHCMKACPQCGREYCRACCKVCPKCKR